MYLGIVLCLCVGAASAATLSCPPCENVLCRDEANSCTYGTVKDTCSCCAICAKGPGEPCGDVIGPRNIVSECGEGLTCLVVDDLDLGFCVPDVNVASRIPRAADPFSRNDPERTQKHDILHDHEALQQDYVLEDDTTLDNPRDAVGQ